MSKGRSTGAKPTTVEPEETYAAIKEAVEALAIPNLSVEDHLYVHGTDIREEAMLLPNPIARPVVNVDDEVLRSMVGTSTQRIRHYQCIRVIDWRGELVMSLYLRFPIHSGRMFCEYNNFLLGPLKDELHRADGMGVTIEVREVLSIARRSGVATLGLWPRSPGVIFKPLTSNREAGREQKEVERNPLFDYGASRTALDRVRSIHYRRFFQRVDKEMYAKLLERLVYDKIIEVLSSHGVDTSPLDESRQTIINNGVMTGDGAFLAGNIAAGTGAGIFNRVRGAMSATHGAGESGGGSGSENAGSGGGG